jgi:hypothetical protein
MQASIKTNSDGSVAMHLDVEAARAIFASVVFASQLHEGIAPLAHVAEKELRCEWRTEVRRNDSCQ